MYVATIIPIARGIPFDTLTYYAPTDLAPGTLVSIPFGRQLIIGIVIESTSLAEAKTLIKQAAFALKKVKQMLGHLPYFEQAILALKATAAQTLAPVGAVAGSTMPQFLFEYMQGEKIGDVLGTTTPSSTENFVEHVVAATIADRADQYKRLIRSAFAAKKSIYFVAPTIRALETWNDRLSKGIQKHIIVLHSKTTKKNLRTYFSLIKSSDRPLLIFMTPGFFLVPRSDLGFVIAEDEGSALYKTNDRFGIDTRILIRHFCEQAHLDLTWGDTMPRLETLERLHADHLPRTYIPDKLHVVAIEHYRTSLPSEVMDLIRHAEKKKFRLFLYATRKGVAPLSRCADCGTIVDCPTCQLPMVLRNRVKQGERERYFVCTGCGDELPPTHLCSYCGSWNITPLPIGTESIRDEVASLVGDDHVFIVDDDTTPDSAHVESLIRSVQQKKFAIIIGTIKVLPYLKGIHYTLFPYFDRMLSTPSLSTTETILRLVMECNEQSSEGVIVCTRNTGFPLITLLETQKVNAIIHDELASRKELGYPPYGLLVKISFTVPEGHRQKVKDAIEHFFMDTDITALPPRRISLGSMKVLMVWIIKAPLSYIEEEGSTIAHFLDTLRYPYKIEQNPDRF